MCFAADSFATIIDISASFDIRAHLSERCKRKVSALAKRHVVCDFSFSSSPCRRKSSWQVYYIVQYNALSVHTLAHIWYKIYQRIRCNFISRARNWETDWNRPICITFQTWLGSHTAGHCADWIELQQLELLPQNLIA